MPSTGPSDANFFGGHPVYLSHSLLGSFEDNDERKSNWIDSVIVGSDTFYYPFKYKIAQFGDPVSEYLMVLRLSEQYLIRAEARANQGNLIGASEDLNLIRIRAGLTNTLAVSQQELISAIMHERQTELFTECGHRWFDL